MPAFATPEGCAAGLAALRTRAVAQASRERLLSVTCATTVTQASRERLVGVTRPSGALNEAESLALFERYGIRRGGAPRGDDAATKRPPSRSTAARPVVVKVLSRDVAHKSEFGGVRLNVAPADVARGCDELRARLRRHAPGARFEGWLVQEQLAGGTELLLGAVRDPRLGSAIVLGAGGTATEVFDDTALRLVPLGPGDPSRNAGRAEVAGLAARVPRAAAG